MGVFRWSLEEFRRCDAEKMKNGKMKWEGDILFENTLFCGFTSHRNAELLFLADPLCCDVWALRGGDIEKMKNGPMKKRKKGESKTPFENALFCGFPSPNTRTTMISFPDFGSLRCGDTEKMGNGRMENGK